MRRIQAPATLTALREALTKVLMFAGETPTWQTFADRALHWHKGDRPVIVVVDDIDSLAATDDPQLTADWSLIAWPNEDDRVREDDGLLFTLARITRTTKGNLRFILTGSFVLGRLWVEAETLLVDTATPIVPQRLSEAERDAWFVTVQHLAATSEVKKAVWEITGGSSACCGSIADMAAYSRDRGVTRRAS